MQLSNWVSTDLTGVLGSFPKTTPFSKGFCFGIAGAELQRGLERQFKLEQALEVVFVT